MIYLDNAATSWPKPEVVHEAIDHYGRHCGASPGRSGHALSIEAARIVFEAREAVAGLFAMSDPSCVFFAKNATEAINLALLGVLGPGDHVVTTALEHNAVIRPLRELERRGAVLARWNARSSRRGARDAPRDETRRDQSRI